MDLDYWWLLLIPVIFGLGWMAARFDLKHLLSESANLPRSYFRGLNFLLNEQPDKAIDAFIEVVKLDPETTELHFALGNLFRRRGETERAIRVHQNLLKRADLPVIEHDHALYELGQDFLKAGLLDRAEETFSQLQSGLYEVDAQRSLLTIFEIEKDWLRAIKTAERLQQQGVQYYAKEISQFYCELAEDALQRQQSDEARADLATALKVNPSNVRATIALGEVKRALGDTEAAIACWLRVEHQNPQYLPMIAERLMQAYTSARREAEGAKVLLDYIEKYPLNDLLDVAFKYISALHGSDAAHILARTQMEKSPNLSGMIRLFDLQIAIAEEPRRRELEMMRNLVFQRTKNLPRYTCQTCGYRTRLFYWRCLGCSGWETYAPRRIEPLLARSA